MLTAVTPAWGSDATPEQEYKKLIHVSQDIQPLGAHPFGENINLYNGALSFQQTDISESGNGPVLQLIRRFNIKGFEDQPARAQYAFGDWIIDLPRMETLADNGDFFYNNVTGGTQRVSGWETGDMAGFTYDPNERCTHFTAPLPVTAQSGASGQEPWFSDDWWKGYHLIIPGQGSQQVLANTDSATNGTYPAVTRSHWRFSCLSSTANGQPGEGFLAQAPDGTKYWFNELVYRYARDMTRPVQSSTASTARPHRGFTGSLFADRRDMFERLLALVTGAGDVHATTTTDAIHLEDAWMLVTKIQDRFGNTLTFSYDSNGHLTGIAASDGRSLSVQYVSGTAQIQSVTLQPSSGAPRTWTYSYSTYGGTTTPSLATVTLPDGSAWRYDFSAFDNASLVPNTPGSCETPGVPGTMGTTWTGTITHPSGLTGAFAVTPMEHGRSMVPRSCVATLNNDPSTGGSYANIPYAWYSYTVTKRTLSGAGISTPETWAYNYSAPNNSWSDCSGTCPTQVWTDVVRPDGSTVRHVFSNRYDITESRLQSVDYYSAAAGSSTLLRSETYHYAAPGSLGLPVDGSGNPLPAGNTLQGNVNQDQIIQYAPQDERVISQDGDTYTWQAQAFNSYAQTTQEKRSNSIAGQTADTTQTSYLNDTTLWVFGLPTQVKDLTTGTVVDSYDYDSSNDTLLDRYHFGQKVMDYAFYTSADLYPGQLKSFTDADGHTTTLGSYKRGIPQSIGYPDSTSQSLVVDDFGDITSITDQAGATTHYSYDAVGRLTRIDYPSDSPTRNPKIFTYNYVTGSERGIGADHWRRTVTQGDSQVVSYFDAKLRPILTDTSIIGDSSSHITQGSTYDWRGLTTFQSYPQSGTPSWSTLSTGTHTTYDALGRETAVSQDSDNGSLTTSTVYLSGARKQVTDPKLNVTTTSYQVFDTPSYKRVTEVDAPDGVTQTIARNIYGNPTSITQAGVTKTLLYDAQQRLCVSTEPESGSTVMAYDAAGNVIWSAAGQSVTGATCTDDQGQVASGVKVNRTYDAMNRVLSISYPDGKGDATFTYGARGALHTSSSPASGADWTYVFGPNNELSSETLSIDGYSWPFTYSYDANGDLASTTYPDGKIIDYAPDALGRPTKAGAYAYGALYYPDGHLENLTYMGGAQYVAEENTRQLLKNLSYAQGSGFLLSEDMKYDADANLTGITDMVDGTRTSSFTYDGLNRLTGATATNLWGTATYGYDALNNITSLTLGGVTNTYNYNAATNRLVSITSGGSTLHSYAYDAQGNTIRHDGTSLVFDQANRLDQVAGLDTYAYDASGHRVKKTDSSGAVTYYAYSSAGQLVWQYDPSTKQNDDYVFLGKKLIAKVQRNAGDPTLNPPAISFDSNPNNGSYTVSWGGERGVSFDLQEQVGTGGWSTVYSGTSQSKSFTGKAGGSYHYRVRECDGDCGDWGESATLGVRPGKPTVTVPGTVQNGPFTISWTTPAGATSYDVQQQLNGGSWTRVASGVNAASYQIPDQPNGSYAYQVEADNQYGTQGWGATSSTVTVLHPPSSAPASISAPSVSSTGSYTVSWGTVSGATSYQLQQQVNGGGWSQIYSGSATSKPVSGVTNGATYGYQARGCNAGGCGPWSVVTSVKIAIPPPVPTNVYANDEVHSINLETLTIVWDAVSGASRYEVQDVTHGNTVYSGTNTSYGAESGPAGTLADDTYAVRSCNPYACSTWVTAIGRDVTPLPQTTMSISGPTSSSTGSYTLNWNAADAATSYTLQERVNNGSWSTVYTGTAQSDAFSGKPNGTYGYQVEACNEKGCTAWSSIWAVTVLHPPPAPASISVPGSSSGAISVSWSTASTATSYNLQRQINGGSWATVYSGGGTSYSTTLTSSGSYVYRVQGCNSSGCGSYKTSSTVTVTLPPNVPTLNVPGTSSNGSYTVSWSSLSTATSYTLQQQINGGSWSTAYSGSGTSKGYSGVTNGQNYGYRVRGCNAGGCGSWSTTKTVKVMETPTNVQVTYRGTKVLYEYANWDAMSNANHYELRIDSTSNSTAYSGTATSYMMDSALFPNMPPSHTPYVRACYANGCSAWASP